MSLEAELQNLIQVLKVEVDFLAYEKSRIDSQLKNARLRLAKAEEELFSSRQLGLFDVP